MATADARAEIRAQVSALNELAARAVNECNLKCVPKARDGELTVAEMACIDRCVPKFVATLDLVTKELAVARGGEPAPPPK